MRQKNNKKNTSPPVIIFLGPQGSGKGTQARLLVEKYNFHLLEMGGLLRAEVKRATALGKKIESTIEQGRLVPSWVPRDLVRRELPKLKSKPIVIDGAPRQVVEAIAHEQSIHKNGREISAIFYITLSNKEALKRLALRGRQDDTPEKIKRRLAWSRAKLGKIVKYFSPRYPVIEINGEQAVGKVHRDILKALKKHEII